MKLLTTVGFCTLLSPAPCTGSDVCSLSTCLGTSALAALRVAALCKCALLFKMMPDTGLSSQRGALVPVTAAYRLGMATSRVVVLFGSVWARVAYYKAPERLVTLNFGSVSKQIALSDCGVVRIVGDHVSFAKKKSWTSSQCF